MRFVETLAGRSDQHAVESALNAWVQEVENARWDNPAAVRKSYGTASIINEERVVFNIKGNSYRLVVAIQYRRGIVFIKWLGSHKDYDTIDAGRIQYGDQTYTKRRGS
ncbi:MAG: type II toxin-antitoxin system HigB family toxin [Bryobacteraceae bacterium]